MAIHLATFQLDASVPIGHPLCGGWIKPAERVVDPLLARGIVLMGNEAPVVLCAVDWTGICNASNIRLRETIAAAAHTTADRVALHAVHQHNAPFVDESTQDLIDAHASDLPGTIKRDWVKSLDAALGKAVRDACAKSVAISHVGVGVATVAKVASNRRIVGPNGKISGWRASSCRDAKLRALPDGVIDPQLTMISFWANDRPLAAASYYAVHPMSYYGDGLVNSDFVGWAREAFAKETGSPLVHFNGCAGNITAGKYNDGSIPMRLLLAERLLNGLRAASLATVKRPVDRFDFKTTPIPFEPTSEWPEDALLSRLKDRAANVAERTKAAMRLAFRRRLKSQPILATRLRLGDSVDIVGLPAESFVEYQLAAKSLAGAGRAVAVAAYADGGPWYLPTDAAFAEGGYEALHSFAEKGSEAPIRRAVAALVAP